MSKRVVTYMGSVYALWSLERSRRSHEKCEAGTHWHEDQKKCMKVSPELDDASESAKRWSDHAVAASRDAQNEKSRARAEKRPDRSNTLFQRASELHTTAKSSKHGKAHKLAKKEGFKELASNHNSWYRHHIRAANRLLNAKR